MEISSAMKDCTHVETCVISSCVLRPGFPLQHSATTCFRAPHYQYRYSREIRFNRRNVRELKQCRLTKARLNVSTADEIYRHHPTGNVVNNALIHVLGHGQTCNALRAVGIFGKEKQSHRPSIAKRCRPPVNDDFRRSSKNTTRSQATLNFRQRGTRA